jgi:hypothetical protein
MYLAKVASYLKVGGTNGVPNATTFVEGAISGCNHQRYLNALNRDLVLNQNDLIVGLPMFNTMRTLGPDPSNTFDLSQSLEAILSYFAVPEALKVRTINIGTTTQNSAIKTSGTWAYFNVTASSDLNNLAIRSNSSGATATFPIVNGDTIYIWYFRSVLNELFNVSIDGQTYQVGGPVTFNSFLNSGNQWQLDVLRISGLNAGDHTVICSQGTNQATIMGIAGFNAATITEQAPAVLVGSCMPMITNVAAQGYAFAGNVGNDPLSQNGSIVLSAGTVTNAPFSYGHAGCDFYNKAINRAVDNLREDGLRVQYVDTASAILASSNASVLSPDIGTDFVHFSNSGNDKIYRKIRKYLA